MAQYHFRIRRHHFNYSRILCCFAMDLNFVVAPIFLVIVLFDSKCSGKYVTNNLLDVFPIQKLGTISAQCKSNHTFSKCDGNLNSTIDGDSYTYWRGPSLVNGNEFPEVNIDINFDEAVHVAKFSIEFVGSRHAPAMWSLEKSTDFGKTWSVWQYFVKDADNCELLGITSSTSNEVSDVDNEICSSQSYAKNQLIVVDLMDTKLFKYKTADMAEALEERSLATNIRLHFYEWKVNIKPMRNSNIGESHFYAVNEIEMLGYCKENGHFSGDATEVGHRCDHNTVGICCSRCKDGFKKSEWKPYTKHLPFECESCNCNGHSNRCIFDESHGDDVCQDCQHNTDGIKCNRCKAGFYRPRERYWNDTSVCQPCNCDAFSLTGNCAEETGQCECKMGYHGAQCAICSPGFTDYPDCKRCSAHGTDVSQSKPNECACKPNFTGKFCDECICSDFKHPYCNEIVRIKAELAKVEDMANFSVNCRSSDFGLSFLHVAAMHGLTDIITELARFGRGSLVDSVDHINQTPIVYGIAYGEKKAVTELIRLRANIKCQVDDYGLAPLDQAKAVGDQEMIEILEDAGARESSTWNKLSAFLWYEIGALKQVPEKYERKLQKESQIKAKCAS